MRHPALNRAFAVFLAVVSALTFFSGAWSIRKAEKDRETSARRTEILTGQIEHAAELRDGYERKREEAETLSAELPGKQEAYQDAASAYRADLNQYTLTRAGIVIGRLALAQGMAALQQGREQLDAGRSAVEQGRAAFEPVYAAYLNARSGLDTGWDLWQEGINRLVLEDEAPQDILQPEDALQLVSTARSLLGTVETLVEGIRNETPENQTQTAQALMAAVETLQSLSTVGTGDVQSLSLQYAEGIYEQARAIAAERLSSGMSEEEALASADTYVMQALGLGYGELESWLEENRGSASSLPDLPAIEWSDEQAQMIMSFIPADRELLDEALSILQESDADLALREAEIRANPEALNAPELLMSVLQLRLESTERLFDLFEPQIVEAKKQLDMLAEQMAAAEELLAQADQGIQDGWYALYLTEQGLTDTEEELTERKQELEAEYHTLSELEQRADSFADLSRRYDAARIRLLSAEGVSARVEAGEDLLAAAEQERDQLLELTEAEHRDRIRMCVLMLAGAGFGLLSALCAFEKLPIRRGWIFLIPAILLTAAGQIQSILLGRGLWYTALFTTAAALAMLPISFTQK